MRCVRLLDRDYGQIGLLGPFDTEEAAVEAGFNANAGNHPVGADGKAISYSLSNDVSEVGNNVVALPTYGVLHLATSPMHQFDNGRWHSAAGEDGDNHYYRRDYPRNHIVPWPPEHKDQL